MQPTRRDVIVGAALLTLSACTEGPRPAPVAIDPDVALLAGAVSRERSLLAAYQARPATPTLIALISDVQAHLVRLAAVPLAQPTAAAPASAVATTPRNLARATSAAHAADVPSAGRTLAPVLASLAAAAASHAAVL